MLSHWHIRYTIITVFIDCSWHVILHCYHYECDPLSACSNIIIIFSTIEFHHIVIELTCIEVSEQIIIYFVSTSVTLLFIILLFLIFYDCMSSIFRILCFYQDIRLGESAGKQINSQFFYISIQTKPKNEINKWINRKSVSIY